MTPPETLLRQRVADLIETEFAPEGITVENDRLVRAAGKDGQTRVAVSPDDATPNPRDLQVLETMVTLQYYLPYTAEPDETIVVDPGVIENVANRIRTAVRNNQSGALDDFWFFNLVRITYPPDPTGNKSRLEATFKGCSTNPAAL